MLKPMSEAPKDRTSVLALMKTDLSEIRSDLDRLHGLWVVVRYDGYEGNDTFGLAGPFGYGGLPPEWFVGWQELPTNTN